VRHRTLLLLLAALIPAACTPEPKTPADVISRERFVMANVAVRTLPDSASKAQREAALRKARVTEPQMRAWVTANGRHPETLAAAWEEIAFKVDSIGGAKPAPDAAAQTDSGVPAPPPVAAPSPIIDESGRVVVPQQRRPRRLELPEEEAKPRRRAPAAVQ